MKVTKTCQKFFLPPVLVTTVYLERETKAIPQVPITESIPLRIATIMSMMKYEFEKYKDCKFEEKINFHLVLSELPAK